MLMLTIQCSDECCIKHHAISKNISEYRNSCVLVPNKIKKYQIANFMICWGSIDGP